MEINRPKTSITDTVNIELSSTMLNRAPSAISAITVRGPSVTETESTEGFSRMVAMNDSAPLIRPETAMTVGTIDLEEDTDSDSSLNRKMRSLYANEHRMSRIGSI